MRNLFNDFLIQIKAIWARLDAGQRLVVSVVLGATIVGLGGIVWYAGRPSYDTVFTARTPEEIAQMQQALGQAGVSYTMDDSGFSFQVERSKVGLANLAKNKAGLLGRNDAATSGSSSIMDDAETKAFNLANASRALAERAILGLDGVVAVTVTAFKPRRQNAFRDRDGENKPTATVSLRLRSGTTFLEVARNAGALVSSQLGIPPQNVVVVNSVGGQRYQYDPDREAGGGSSEFLTLQRSLGDQKASLAQELLDQMWPGKTSVAVHVELDPSWEVVSQKVLPSEPLVLTDKSTKDSTEKTPGRPADAADTGATGAKDAQKNETRDRTYVTEIGEKRTGKLAPDVRRMTVAVLYDKSLDKGAGFNREELKKAVKAIVGWDRKRDSDDDFSILPGDFQPVDLNAAVTTGPGFGEIALRWGPTVGQVLGVIVVVFFLKGLFKRSSREAAPSPATPHKDDGRQPAVSAEDEQKRIRREIERSIAEDPAALARLLESWMTEQKA